MAVTRGLALPGAAHAPRGRLRGQAAALASPSGLAVITLTVVGAILRVVVARQSVFADELSTYWIVTKHSLGGVLSLLYSTGRIQHAEITPPLSFVASWLTTRLGSSPVLLRLPELVAGTATIPLVYVLGFHTVGRRAALLAAAVTTLSPFMIYYSAEARAYGLLLFFVVLAALWMIRALQTGRRRYWILYAVCAAAAFWTHTDSVFVLAVAFVWLLWAHPEARRPALLSTAGAVVLVLPWIPGLIADLQSPTLKITSALSPFTLTGLRLDLEHWSVGYPYSNIGLERLPGTPALLVLALAIVLSAVGLAWRARRRQLGKATPLLVLLALLMLATPVGEAIVSSVGDHIIGTRYLSPSWPFLALFCSALALAAGRRLGVVVAALVVVTFAVGAVKMLEPQYSRPNYRAGADYVARHARPGDVAIDMTGVLSPGPVSGFDVFFHRRLPVVRGRFPAERDHPFTVFDPRVSTGAAVNRAVRLARDHTVFVVVPQILTTGLMNPIPTGFPAPYRLARLVSYPGIQGTLVATYSRSGSP